MADKYDEAVEYLTRNPERILDAWKLEGPGAALFGFTGDHGYCNERGVRGQVCGCLTQVRKGVGSTRRAATPALTRAIRADRRIPKDQHKITVRHLPVFAEWQRKLDEKLGRVG